MGWAPPGTEHMDAVFVLLGSDVPWILRPIGDGELYKVVGEAYIDGYMYGRGIDQMREGTLSKKWIELH